MNVASCVDFARRGLSDGLVLAGQLDHVQGGFATEVTLEERLFLFDSARVHR